MPPPIWLREPIRERRNSKHYTVKSDPKPDGFKADGSTTTTTNSQQKLQEVVNDLQKALIANETLKNENSSLKTDLVQLCSTNEQLMNVMKENKEKFEQDINELQEEIKKTEATLINNNKRCVQQQKKYAEQIKELLAEKEDLAKQIASKEKEFTSQVTKLENEMKSTQETLRTLRAQHKECIHKSSKYKNKLKYAIMVINDLNNMVIECTTKPDTKSETTQTEKESINQPAVGDATSKSVAKPQDVESMLLSDIFFKSKSFNDEFLQKESLLNFNKIQK